MTTDNKFEMVLLAAARARQIKLEENRHYELGKNTGPSACVRAIQEIESGKLTWDSLKRANTEI